MQAALGNFGWSDPPGLKTQRDLKTPRFPLNHGKSRCGRPSLPMSADVPGSRHGPGSERDGGLHVMPEAAGHLSFDTLLEAPSAEV